MEEKQTQNRPIDDLAKQSYDFWSDSFVFIKKARIKTWQAIFAIAFIAGVASAMVLTFSFDWSESTSAATLSKRGPDLIVQSITISTSTIGSVPAYKYTIKIKNSGTAAAGQSVVNVSLTPVQPQSFNDNGINKMQCSSGSNQSIIALNPGQITQIDGYFNPITAGIVTIKATADYSKLVTETNEYNNVLSKAFKIVPTVSKEFCPNSCADNLCTVKTYCSDYIVEANIGTQIKYVTTGENKYPNATRWPGFENIHAMYTTTCNGFYANYPTSANVTSEINIYASSAPQIAQDIELWRKSMEAKGLQVRKSLVKNSYVIDVISENNIWVGWASGNKAVFVISNSAMIYPNTVIDAYLAKYPSDLKADAVATCSDTDGGLNYYTKGSVTFTGQTSYIPDVPGGNVYSDNCGGQAVNEYYCENGSLKSVSNLCALGCSNGVCVATSTPLTCQQHGGTCAHDGNGPCIENASCPDVTTTRCNNVMGCYSGTSCGTGGTCYYPNNAGDTRGYCEHVASSSIPNDWSCGL
jgi:hypothetical protein